MKWLLPLVLVVLLVLTASLPAGPMLLSSTLTGDNFGTYHNLDTKGSQSYDDPLSKSQAGSSPLTISSHRAIGSIHDQIQIEGDTSGTFTIGAGSGNSTTFTYTSTSSNFSGSSDNRDPVNLKSYLDYNGSFTVNGLTAYTLSISGSVSTSGTKTNPFDSASSSATLMDSTGHTTLASYASSSSNFGHASSDTGPISMSGLLTYGNTYSLFAETKTTDGSSTLGDSSESASVSYTLTLTPLPEPATLTLLALGGAGLAGYTLARKRRSADRPST